MDIEPGHVCEYCDKIIIHICRALIVILCNISIIGMCVAIMKNTNITLLFYIILAIPVLILDLLYLYYTYTIIRYYQHDPINRII